MPEKDGIHVTKQGDRWIAKREGAKRASGTGETQTAVEKLAKKLASRSGGAQVVIHRPDGTIRDADTIPNANESRKRDTKH
jgi:hypothetical protein